MRVLLIEDEAPLAERLAARLRAIGYAVDLAGTLADGRFLGDEYPVDLAIVDLGLPDGSGLDAIRAWRAEGRDFPVLILTARGRWQEKVDGLEAGADDYLTKPFAFEELAARLRALVRRAGGRATPELRSGPVVVDPRAQQVHLDGEPLELTAFEYRVLEYLLHQAGRVVSKSELTEHIYEEDQERDSNVLEVLIARLRKKLDPQREWQPIETLRGRGYRWRAPTDEGQAGS